MKQVKKIDMYFESVEYLVRNRFRGHKKVTCKKVGDTIVGYYFNSYDYDCDTLGFVLTMGQYLPEIKFFDLEKEESKEHPLYEAMVDVHKCSWDHIRKTQKDSDVVDLILSAAEHEYVSEFNEHTGDYDNWWSGHFIANKKQIAVLDKETRKYFRDELKYIESEHGCDEDNGEFYMYLLELEVLYRYLMTILN